MSVSLYVFTVKLEDFQSAVTYFEKALEKAKRIHNDAAQQAIIIVSNTKMEGGKKLHEGLGPMISFHGKLIR